MTAFDLGLLVLRFVVGLTFAAHGAQKAFGWWGGSGWAGWTGAVTKMGFRPAPLWTAVSVGAELVGGLALALGLVTPLAAMVLVGQAVVIILKAHWAKGFWDRNGGFEFPLALGTGAAALGLTGPGSVSLDEALGFALPDEVRIGLVAVGLLGGAVAFASSLAGARPAIQ